MFATSYLFLFYFECDLSGSLLVELSTFIGRRLFYIFQVNSNHTTVDGLGRKSILLNVLK